MKHRVNQTVRINDPASEFHKLLAKVVAVGTTRMRVVPEQLTGVRRP